MRRREQEALISTLNSILETISSLSERITSLNERVSTLERIALLQEELRQK